MSDRKADYARYLESGTWKRLRRRALKRDKGLCRACKEPAQVVHHIRYPKTLGQEKLEWLYSLCVSCHDEIHRRAAEKGTTLRQATNAVLGITRSKKPKRKAKQRKPVVVTSLKIRTGGPRLSPATKKRRGLAGANDELHEIQKRARENRERRAAA